MRKFIFGPVPSRRLGRSLGVDLTPSKTCSLNCRYCQLSETTTLTSVRSRFCDPETVLCELKEVLSEMEPPDWITFSGTGEPTLYEGLGEIISSIKKSWKIPVCVITNGVLLARKDVRQDLMQADRILPTLCTVFEKTFKEIHRPAPEIKFENILSGLKKFSSEYRGILEIEIFVCPGLNDTDEEIAGLSHFLSELKGLHGIFLNSAVRQPVDPGIRPATAEIFEKFKQRLGMKIPVSTALEGKDLKKPGMSGKIVSEDEILSLLQRHPCNIAQLELALGGSSQVIATHLECLKNKGMIQENPEGLWLTL